jgi:hypothetical protein
MKALLDTTIVVDVLLNTAAQGDNARRALRRYDATLLPHYAIKEFKAGALNNYIWLHTKICQLPTWAEALEAVRRTIGFRRNLPSTALQALAQFESSIERITTDAVAARYPGMARGQMMKTEAQIWLKQHIMRAWRKRRKIASAVTASLPCYVERAPVVQPNGLLVNDPVKCNVPDCSLRKRYLNRLNDIESLERACTQVAKNEVVRRRRALKQLRRNPGRPLEEKYCRWLGDAVFALECPADAVVLTTNIVDHRPLANAIGREVEAP